MPEEEEQFIPMAVRQLFDEKNDFTLRTETPSKMIPHMVRMAMMQACITAGRRKPLLQVFREEFDKRMISKERKGRLELLAAMSAVGGGEPEEEGVL